MSKPVRFLRRSVLCWFLLFALLSALAGAAYVPASPLSILGAPPTSSQVEPSPLFGESLSASISGLEAEPEPPAEEPVEPVSAWTGTPLEGVYVAQFTTSYTCLYTCGVTCGTTCGTTCAGTSTCLGSMTCQFGPTCTSTCAITCDTTCAGKATCATTCAGKYTCVYTCIGSVTCSGSTCTTPDTTKPTVSHAATYANYLTKVTITATDGGGSGVKHIDYKVDGGSTKTVTGASALVELKSFGAHTLEYRAQDKAGNTSAWKKVTLYVKRGTTLSINAPETCAYRSAKLYGYLKYYTTSGAKKPAKGKTIAIQQYKSGKWETIAKVTTSDTGRWAYTAKPSKKATYRVRYAGSNTYVAKTSAKKTVLPKVSLGRPSGPETLKVNTVLTVRGSLKPRHTAGTKPVRIQAYRSEGGKWVLKKTYYASVYNYDTYSRYKADIKLTSKGTWRIRAYYPTSATNYKTYSSYRYITAN